MDLTVPHKGAAAMPRNRQLVSRVQEQRTVFVHQWQDVLPPSSLGFKMRAVNQLMLRRYGNAFAPFDVTPYQWLVLACLWQEDGLSVSAVTTRLIQVGGTMTGILQGMEKAGMITRQTSPEDRRIARLWLTDKGRELLDTLMPIARNVRRDVYGCLSEDEEGQLTAILDKMLTNLV
jgi:MarR family transcriptional regulator, organic hydroperoxide resistance regulator